MSFYLLDKQSGVTSNKALSELKHELGIKKAGFSGVLDPFATGLLVVATNGDTRFLEQFLMSAKTYTGVILFGKMTDTLDTEGEVVEEVEGVSINIDAVKEVIENKFLGKIKQVPPVFSNIKVDGKRSHELAREGKEVTLKEVEREILMFNVELIDETSISFEVKVSSGTYIRSLARDLGKELGYPAMLTELRRTKVGNVEVPAKTTEVERKDILDFEFETIQEDDMTDLMNGKIVRMQFDYEEVIVECGSNVLWIKKRDYGYKINKRIQ